MNDGKSESFIYWKKPYQKWLVFIAGVLQFVSLFLNIQEYREIAEAGVFSSEMWESYAAEQIFRCALNGLTATIFLGVSVIGSFSHSQKSARIAEGVLMLILSLVWGAVGVIFKTTPPILTKFTWVLLLLVLFFGGIYTIWKGIKS